MDGLVSSACRPLIGSGLEDLHRQQGGVVLVVRLRCGIEDFRDDILIPDTSIGPPLAIWLAYQSRMHCPASCMANAVASFSGKHRSADVYRTGTDGYNGRVCGY
jgi:hypothetical protein